MVKTARKGGLMDFCVGIDVSKFKHTVAFIDQNGEVRKRSFDVSNSRKGFDSLLNELGLLGQKEQIKIGMEATGHYMKCLVRCLISNGYRVQIYNPNLIAGFRESEAVNLAKTDNLDAMLIAKYVATHPFTSSPQIIRSFRCLYERADYALGPLTMITFLELVHPADLPQLSVLFDSWTRTVAFSLISSNPRS